MHGFSETEFLCKQRITVPLIRLRNQPPTARQSCSGIIAPNVSSVKGVILKTMCFWCLGVNYMRCETSGKYDNLTTLLTTLNERRGLNLHFMRFSAIQSNSSPMSSAREKRQVLACLFFFFLQPRLFDIIQLNKNLTGFLWKGEQMWKEFQIIYRW